MAGVYYENAPVTLAVPSGQSKLLALPYPNRVRLTKLNIIQSVGTPGAFRVDLYNRRVGDAAAVGLSDYPWLISEPAGIASDASGRLNHKFPDYDVFFFNQDDPAYLQVRGADSPSLVSTQAKYNVYLRITNGSGGDATYLVILGSESPHEL